MEAVQRKMNIYGKYLPLIAQFSQDLAGKKKPPDYSKLMGETGEQEGAVQDSTAEQTATGQEGVPTQSEQEIEQKTIDEYGGS